MALNGVQVTHCRTTARRLPFAYLDLIYRVKKEFGYPLAAYAVSAEYSMIKAGAQNGWIDEKAVVMESHLAMRRAGADILITYWAREIARWLKG